MTEREATIQDCIEIVSRHVCGSNYVVLTTIIQQLRELK